jgi:hypothetical protein
MHPKLTIKNTFLHFGKILKHKWWVFYYCCQADIPWRGVKHDMSKFSPTEFWESVRYYQGTSSPIDACKKDKGISMAWMHHKGRNRHHYEYWQDNFDNGGEPKAMPYKDAVEMLCDYLGAGRAYMGRDFTYQKEYEWWCKKCQKPLAMHPNTLDFITRCMSQFNHGLKLEDIDIKWNYYIAHNTEAWMSEEEWNQTMEALRRAAKVADERAKEKENV